MAAIKTQLIEKEGVIIHRFGEMEEGMNDVKMQG